MELFAIACCVVTGIMIIFTIAIKLSGRRHFYEKASKFSGPPCLPLIGNAHLLIGNTEAILDKMTRLGKLYPSPYRLWIGHHLLFFVSTPEELKIVSLSPNTIDKGELLDFGRPWLGTGLFTASDEKWRVHRKLIEPTFNSNIVQSFVEVFATQSLIMAKQIERHLDGPEFNMHNYLLFYGLDSVCETSMGVSLAAQTDGNSYFAEAVQKVVAGICTRAFTPWLHPDSIFYRTQLGKDQRKYIDFLHSFTNNVIQMKKKELRACKSLGHSSADNEDECNSAKRRKVFLDHLIDLSHDNETLTDEAIREEVDTMTAAATETTAVIISYAMLMLASHPEVQEKVYQELCEIYGEDDEVEVNVTPGDLKRMNYLERVIKETMRLFPIAPFLIRAVKDDLDIGNRTFPKGSFIILGILDLHRNENYWPNSLEFDPDRFLPEAVAKRDPYVYLPFSRGLRGCIGSKYAMMSMKTLLSTILRRFVLKKDNIVPVKNIRLKMEFVLRPVDPIMLRIKGRTQKDASMLGISSQQ